MYLKKKIRELLLEKQKRTYDYGCLMANLSVKEI